MAEYKISLEARDTKYLSCTKIPTLEELIDACGEKFAELKFESGRWHTFGYGLDEHGNHFMACGHSNPAEAVAKLWLALNPPNQETK